jgi:hypothetical protein
MKMKNRYRVLFMFLSVLFALLTGVQTGYAAPVNGSGSPVMPGWYADPDLQVFNGKYYLYPTNSTSSYNTQYHAYSSDDMVNWKDEGVMFDFATISWCHTQAWAPAVTQRNGTYYLYFSACDGKIGVATSSSPAGPFTDALGGPLLSDPRVAPCYADIDPAAFIDTDGQAYLVFGTENLCIRKLNPDMTSFADQGPTQLTFNQPGYKEGSYMVKRNNIYYLSWSTGGWGDCTYNVHYGRSNTPFGPFTDEGSILTTNGVQTPIGCGPGHHAMFKSGSDDWFIVYHKHPVGYVQGEHRYVSIDKLNFNTDGSIQPVTMTGTGVEGRLTNDTPSLTGWWKLNESAGTAAADSSVNGHNATISGPLSWTTGKIDGGFNFQGAAYAAAASSVNTNASFSVSAWVKLNNLNGYQTFVSQDGANVSGFFLQYSQDFGNKFAFSRLGSDSASAAVSRAYSTTVPVIGEWYHLTGVYDSAGSELRLYVNGKLEGTQSYSGSWSATGPTVIGAGLYNGRTDYANAVIDQVRTFAYALSDGIAKREYLYSPNLNLYWDFDEASGNANDVSGSAQLNFGDYGVLNAGAVRTNGRTGNGIAFNGTGSYVSSSSTTYDKRYSLVDTATDYSVSAWVKPNTIGGWQTFVSVDGSNVSGFFLQMGDVGSLGGNKFAFSVTDSDSTASASTRAVSTTITQANVWYHVVGVHDRTNGALRLYVNGNMEATVAISSGWAAQGNVIVGAGKWGSRSDYFNGTIDEVRIYNKALNAAEVANLVNGHYVDNGD